MMTADCESDSMLMISAKGTAPLIIPEKETMLSQYILRRLFIQSPKRNPKQQMLMRRTKTKIKNEQRIRVHEQAIPFWSQSGTLNYQNDSPKYKKSRPQIIIAINQNASFELITPQLLKLQKLKCARKIPQTKMERTPDMVSISGTVQLTRASRKMSAISMGEPAFSMNLNFLNIKVIITPNKIPIKEETVISRRKQPITSKVEYQCNVIGPKGSFVSLFIELNSTSVITSFIRLQPNTIENSLGQRAGFNTVRGPAGSVEQSTALSKRIQVILSETDQLARSITKLA